MMAYQNKKEAQARIDPQADPVAVIYYTINLVLKISFIYFIIFTQYAAMMAYQQKSDPAVRSFKLIYLKKTILNSIMM